MQEAVPGIFFMHDSLQLAISYLCSDRFKVRCELGCGGVSRALHQYGELLQRVGFSVPLIAWSFTWDGREIKGSRGPDGQVKFPHPWPPQIPPGRTAGL